MTENNDMDFKMKSAEKYGWRGEIAEMVLNAWSPSKSDAAWKLIAKPENDFEAASYALFRRIFVERDFPELAYKRTMRLLTSKEEGGKGSFTPQQYIRELCQNALDTIIDGEELIINFCISESSMTYSHNGRSFRGPRPKTQWGEMGALYEPGITTKSGSFSSEGRFGIGFKGWMLFYNSIQHQHSNGSQEIIIEYEFAGKRINANTVRFEGPQLSNNTSENRVTSYTFSKPNDDLVNPTLDEVIEEWSPMINLVDHNIKINITVGDKNAVLTHKCDERVKINDTSNETYAMKLSTLIERDDDRIERQYYCNYNYSYGKTAIICEKRFWKSENSAKDEMPKCPHCKRNEFVEIIDEKKASEKKKFVVIRSKIADDERITNAVKQLIDTEKQEYVNAAVDKNPWSDVKPSDWYNQQKITLGISMDDVKKERTWMYSLAKISKAKGWPNYDLKAKTNWIINGPFFLSPTRKELNESEIDMLANAAILEFGLKNCVGELASRLLELDKLQKLNISSPFDIILEESAPNPSGNPFHNLLLKDTEEGEITYKTFHSVFGGRPLYSDHSGILINANVIRRIPQSWKVAKGDDATTLTDWIQQQDTDILDEHWAMIPYSHDEESRGFINEKTAPLANLIPELKKEELYELLEKSQLLVTLKENYPDVIYQDWYEIELPKGTDCIIFGERPPNDPMIKPLIDLVIDTEKQEYKNVHFESDGKSEISRGYEQKKETWTENKGIFCLTVPNEATIEWWFDRLIWMANRNKTYLSSEVIEQLGQIINKSDSASYFVAKIHSYHKGSENELANSKGGFAIIPRKMNGYGSSWTIMPHSLAGWKIKSSYSGSKDYGIWNILDIEKFERIDVSDKIHIGSSNINVEEFYCDYESCNSLIVLGHVDPEKPEIEPPKCSCGDNNDVKKRKGTFLSLIAGKKLTILASEPINPKILLTEMLNYCQDIPTNHKSADDSIILTAEPWPKTKHLTEVLKDPSTHWTKLPTLSIIKETGTSLRYNEVGNDGVDIYDNRNFGRIHGTNSDIKKYYQSFYGHAMNLHIYDESKPQVLLRELGGQSLLNSDEFGSEIRDSNLSSYHNLQLVTQINKDRYIRHAQKTLLFLRITRNGPQSKFGIRKAAIRSINESSSLFKGDYSIPYDETQKLKEQRLCGFNEEETQSEIKWIISLETSEMSQNREQVYELIKEIEGIEIIHSGNIVVQQIPNSGSLHPGLYRGVEGLLSHVLQVSEDNEDELIYHLLTEVGKIVKTINELLGGEIKLFDNIKVEETQKRLLLDKLEKAMEFFSDENNYLEQLEFFQKGLEFTNVKSWEGTKNHIIEAKPDSEEMWKIYTDYGMLEPNPPAYKCNEKLSKFTRLNQPRVKQNKMISYLDDDDAKELFHLSLKGEKQEDATLWSIDEKGKGRICIIEDDLKMMLNAQSAKDSIIGTIDLNKVVRRCKPLEDGETAEIKEKWAFAQILIGIYAYSKYEKHSDVIDHIPNIRAKDSTERCEIFEGPSVNLGKGGWDIRGSVTVDEKRDAYLMLVTSDPENGNKGSLLTLLHKTKILKRQVLRRITLNTPEGIQELAETLDVEVETIEKLVNKIKSDDSIGGAKLLNPWNKDENEEWISKFGQSPEWLTDKAEAIKKSSANKLLRQYTSALNSLLNRGAYGLGPVFGEKTQEKITALPDIRDKIKGDLYPNTASIIIDEPIIYAKGELVPTMGNIRRHQEGIKSYLIERAGLKEFVGNQLFLSRYSAHRGTMTSDPYGLKQRIHTRTIQSEVHRLLKHKDAWGNGETILLRDVMQIGNGNYVSICLHKYHAVCMIALDDALDHYEEQENDQTEMER